MPKYNAWTICDDGSGQESGLFAEMRFASLLMQSGLSFKYVAAQKQFHDFEVYTTKNKTLKVDVKCKQRNVPFDPKFHGHVESRLKNEDCDIYVFAHAESYDLVAPAIQLVGWQWCHLFWSEAELVKKGDKDGQLTERADAGKVGYWTLRPMEDLAKNLL